MATNPGKLLGNPPDPFDGSALKAESFWSQLENYYYLNSDNFSDESRRVSSALTHFKLGTTAGEWARDLTQEALKRSPVDFGTWANFRDQFKIQFIPVESHLDATNKMHSTIQGNRPFNEWYQEWSTYANRANVDDNTKIYAFRKCIIPALNDKLLGVNPPPKTLTELVNLCRAFEQSYRLFGRKLNNFGRRFQELSLDSSSDNPDTSIELNYSGPLSKIIPGGSTANQNNKRKFTKLTPGQRQYRIKNKLCLYCGEPGHFSNSCPKKSSRTGTSGNQSRKLRAAPTNQDTTDQGGQPGGQADPSNTVTLSAMRSWYEEPIDRSRLVEPPTRSVSTPPDPTPSGRDFW